MEDFLQGLLPHVLPEGCTFDFHVHQGKPDLLRKLGNRLRGFSRWLPADWRIVVVVDSDNEDCRVLKDKLEQAAANAGLLTRSQAHGGAWRVVNRIAIRELEAWYFGDWEAVCQAYPRVRSNIPRQARYRDPDAIRGKTCKAFHRILKERGYFRAELHKVEAAQAIAPRIDPARNRSRSFTVFHAALVEATV